jgi:hypothetical protein
LLAHDRPLSEATRDDPLWKTCERLPNRVPGFSPTVGGGLTICSRSSSGGLGSARLAKC